MDEIFGYMPPVAEPPSKKPLLTLLKQARAYGLGVVLATQNPVDLDYKGLSNTGTWFLGRLQTERDKMRVLDGLEGAGGVDGFDRQKAEAILSGLGKRTFWLHNVHDSEPVIFRTRWVMSYLRGPLTRDQIGRLMEGRKREEDSAQSEGSPLRPSTPSPTGSAGERPVTPPDTPEVFLPVRHYAGELRYAPAIIGMGKVHFTNRQRTREATESISLLQWLEGEGGWSGGEELAVDSGSLQEDPPGPALFDPLPSKVANPKSLAKRSKALSEWLYRERRYELLRSPSLDEISHPGESEGEFRVRLRERAREERDEQVAALRKKYASRLRTLRDRIQRAEQKVEREREQVSSKRIDTAISLGSTILSAFLGRKKLSSTTLSKAGTTARTFGRSGKEAEDVRRAEESLETLEEQLRDLETDLEREIDEMGERYEPMNEELEIVALRPRRTDVQVEQVALAWVPYTRPTPSEHRWLYKA